MARQTVNTGAAANDNTGDTMRDAGTKINANFTEIYTILGGDSVTPTTNMQFGNNTIIAEGTSINENETTLTFTNPTADRTITFPDATGTVQLTGGSQSLTSAVLTTPQIQDTSSNHQYIFAPSELAADRTVTLPLLAGNDTFSFIGFTETLTNKTLTSPVLTAPKFVDAGFIADAAGNEQLVFQQTSSAVNHVELTNAATGGSALINAVGGDANVSLAIGSKGTGSLILNSKYSLATETLTGTTVAASAVKPLTVHNASSAVAASLINGTVAGQIKKFVNIGAGIVTLTPATYYGSNTTIILAQHDNAELLWTGATWYDLGQQIARNGATLKIGTSTSGLATTIGHTTSEVTIGDNLTVAGNLTVTGTTTSVSSTNINVTNAFVFEGATADAHETTLAIIDPTDDDKTISLPNVSGTLPVLAAVSTTAITSTPEELNKLDGATVVVGEINALDLGSTAVGIAIASKAVVLSANKDYTGLRNLTITGEIDAATGDYSGAVDIAGATTVVGLTATGDIKASDGVVSGKREIISTFNTSSAVTGSLTRAQSGGILLIDGTENNVINLPAANTANVGTFYDYIVLTIGASDKTTIFNIAGSGGNFFGTLSLSGGTAANAVIDNGGDALTLVNSTVVGSRGRITCLVDNGTNGTWQVESVGSPIATIA